MKNKLSVLILLLLGFNTYAQLSLSGNFYGEDALKFSNQRNYGSAKVQGMGGAFTALGGDLSNAFINPAGLAFYNKSEFSFSPIFFNQSTSSEYITSKSNASSSAINVGQVGAVFSNRGTGTRKKRTAWAISYNTLLNFSNEYNYSGSNNKSSIIDYFAQRANADGYSVKEIEDGFNSETLLSQNPYAMLYQAFLIDPLNNGTFVVGETSFPVIQNGTVRESGSLGQVNVSYGINFDDRTYVGASIGIQNLSYNQISEHSEDFPKAVLFKSFNFTDDLFVSGNGVNVNIGTIYKLSPNLQIGANIVSPTGMRIKESIVSYLNTTPLPGKPTGDYRSLETVPNDFVYRIASPLKANVGTALFLPKKLGVVSIEAEYVGYSMMNVKDKEDKIWSSRQKTGIQNEFKDVVNIKAGSEIRINNARLRAGLNYLSNPRKNKDAYNASATLIGTFGAGVRNSKYYADLAYSRSTERSAFTPYTLENPTEYASATLSKSRGVLSLTVGTYF